MMIREGENENFINVEDIEFIKEIDGKPNNFEIGYTVSCANKLICLLYLY